MMLAAWGAKLTMGPEEIYRRLGSLAATFPIFDEHPHDTPLTDDNAMWIGRLEAVVEASGKGASSLHVARSYLALPGLRTNAISDIKAVLYSALAAAELRAPAALKGAFIAAGSPFDAFAALAKLLGRVDKGDSQQRLILIQGGFCGGHFDARFDERRGMVLP